MDAAAAGAFIHGMAGDEAAARLGEYSVIASDIVDHLPHALKPFTTDQNIHFV
jgi:NAD(P)H-hydrate epimerase